MDQVSLYSQATLICVCVCVCVCREREILQEILNIFPVAQMVEHGAINAKIMGSIPRESKSW